MMAGPPNPKSTPAPRPAGMRQLPAMSAKRRTIEAERAGYVHYVLSTFPTCQFNVGGLSCKRYSTQVHELVLRSAGGPIAPSQGLTLDGCRALCTEHHRWIHDHPAAATALGYLARTVLA